MSPEMSPEIGRTMTKVWSIAMVVLLAAACAREVRDGSSAGTGGTPSVADADGMLAFIRIDPAAVVADAAGASASLVLMLPGSPARVVGPAARATPAWSPDGSTLAYLGEDGIWISQRGETPSRLIGCDPATCSGMGPPSWSPDGATIAFAGDLDGQEGVWTVPFEGGVPTSLAEGLLVHGAPSWSPDGRTLTVIATETGDDRESVLMLDAGSGEIMDRVTPDGFELGDAVGWSPDGTQLLLAGALGGSAPGAEGVYLMGPEGDGLRLVTSCPDPACIDAFPAWSPDGQRVLFTRGRCDQVGSDCYLGDLYSLELGSDRSRRLTRGPSLDCCAGWQPVGAEG